MTDAERKWRETHAGVRCLVTLAEHEISVGPNGYYVQAEHVDALIDAAVRAAFDEGISWGSMSKIPPLPPWLPAAKEDE